MVLLSLRTVSATAWTLAVSLSSLHLSTFSFIPLVSASGGGRSAVKVASLLWSPISHPLPNDPSKQEKILLQHEEQHVFQLPMGDHAEPAQRLETYLRECSLKALLLVERPEGADTPAAEETALPLNDELKQRVISEGDHVRITEHDVEQYMKRSCHASVMQFTGTDDVFMDLNDISSHVDKPRLIKLSLARLPAIGNDQRIDMIHHQARTVGAMIDLMETSFKQDYMVLFTGSSNTRTARDDIFTTGVLMGLIVSAILIAILMVGIGWLSAMQGAVPMAQPKQKKA
ncbi:hypothetical protein BDF22DRAFT_695714 [Syncephalis plumigaleata]|nr:hypothetical protein BDF22DRAFT_695714 [Syncephalis plumigaleata]